MSSTETAEFDFARMAKTFDLVLPLFEPVTGPLLARASVSDGESVLDVACGTGEPGLTVAERCPGADLLGVDAAEPMIDIARAKAGAKGLSNARFEVMKSQDLRIADDSVDVVVSRFGMLSFANPAGDAREAARVLRPGGRAAIATWDGLCRNPISYAMTTAVRDWLPPEIETGFRLLDEYAMPGRRESWLERGGLTQVSSEPFSWSTGFPDEPALWDFAAGPTGLGPVLDELDDDQVATARQEFDRLMIDYRRPDGSYVLLFTCRLFQARR
ncbi:class I SAM-dependent methyltransferase [Amycolatopsis pigmentata]|uniref:Class I SAM-dependent methyltransferase n=1 Tax=Amycolatopsis pigmentata TaxID=450801 RepID=A0ABW5FXS4_9PSEU